MANEVFYRKVLKRSKDIVNEIYCNFSFCQHGSDEPEIVMKAYIASNFSDEEGPMAEAGKTVYINSSKEKLLELADYFAAVAKQIKSQDTCHMHFRDYANSWNKNEYIDVVIDLDE